MERAREIKRTKIGKISAAAGSCALLETQRTIIVQAELPGAPRAITEKPFALFLSLIIATRSETE